MSRRDGVAEENDDIDYLKTTKISLNIKVNSINFYLSHWDFYWTYKKAND